MVSYPRRAVEAGRAYDRAAAAAAADRSCKPLWASCRVDLCIVYLTHKFRGRNKRIITVTPYLYVLLCYSLHQYLIYNITVCPGCSVPEPYQSPDWALASALTGPRAEYPQQKQLQLHVSAITYSHLQGVLNIQRARGVVSTDLIFSHRPVG